MAIEKASSTEINDIISTLWGNTLIKEPGNSIERFWDTFIIDALIGNTDRHNANWGFLSFKESELLITVFLIRMFTKTSNVKAYSRNET